MPELRVHTLQPQSLEWHLKHQSLIEPRRIDGISGSRTTIAGETSLKEPPPLPLKKKHSKCISLIEIYFLTHMEYI